VSNKESKVKEMDSYKLLTGKKHDMALIVKGLENYKKPDDDKYITALPNFIRNKIYLDLQEKEFTREIGGYTF
jgi:predicted transcriptional regulator